MAHGTPDYGVTGGAVTVFQVNDLGELAARLGSPITYDRSGDVVWWDDFECGLAKWNTTFVNGAGSAAISAERARNGRSALKVVTAAAITARVDMSKPLPFPSPSLLGVEASAMFTTKTRAVRWGFSIFDGSGFTAFGVKWDSDSDTLLYLNAGGGYTTFATGVSVVNNDRLFHTGKIVGDFVNQRYERFILNNERFDMSALIPQTAVSGQDPHWNPVIGVEATAGNAVTQYWDDVIVTQNEPANG